MAFANVPVQMMNAADTQNENGPPVFCGQFFAGSFTTTFADTSVAGSIQIQASNETAPRSNLSTYVPSTASWNNIPNATAAVVAGVCNAIVLPTLNYQYVRAVFTYTSGGSSTITINGNFFST
jgi:hypothetical protein